MPDFFLFDIGNVIIRFDFGVSARRLAERSQATAAEIIERLSPLTVDLELGRVGVGDFIAEASSRIGYEGDAESFRSVFADIFELNDAMVEVIAALKAEGKPLFLLSNTNAIHAPFFEEAYPVFGLFDGRIYSHEVGLMKPDPAIYELAKRSLPLDPARTLYIDDLPANCEAGAAAGFLAHAYAHDRHEEFMEALARHRA
jgi:HAD superfamily hydrolase (TIGR01509 family)